MELRHLRYFLAVADTLNFTRAAAKLHITQPTLSHQIKQLEQETGPLLDRTRHSVRLTQQGKLLRPYAERAVGEIRNAMMALGELDGLLRGELAVGVFRSFSSSRLPDVFARFNSEYPGVRLTVREMHHVEIERALIDGRLDLAVAYGPAISDKIVAEEIFTERLELVVGTNHPLARCKRVKLEQLEGVPLALVSRDTRSRKLIDECLAAHRVTPRIEIEMNSVDAVLATVGRSALATVCVSRTLLNSPNLRAIRIDEAALRRSTSILWLADSHQSAAARALTRQIREDYATRAITPPLRFATSSPGAATPAPRRSPKSRG